MTASDRPTRWPPGRCRPGREQRSLQVPDGHWCPHRHRPPRRYRVSRDEPESTGSFSTGHQWSRGAHLCGRTSREDRVRDPRPGLPGGNGARNSVHADGPPPCRNPHPSSWRSLMPAGSAPINRAEAGAAACTSDTSTAMTGCPGAMTPRSAWLRLRSLSTAATRKMPPCRGPTRRAQPTVPAPWRPARASRPAGTLAPSERPAAPFMVPDRPVRVVFAVRHPNQNGGAVSGRSVPGAYEVDVSTATPKELLFATTTGFRTGRHPGNEGQRDFPAASDG